MITKTTLSLWLAAGALSLAAAAPAKATPLGEAFGAKAETNVEQVLHRCVDTPNGVVCGRVCPDGHVASNDYCGYGPYGDYRPYRHGWGRWW